MAPRRALAILILSSLLSACAMEASGPRTPSPPSAPSAPVRTTRIDPAHVDCLKRDKIALLPVMHRPMPLTQIRVAVAEHPHGNAGSAGGGSGLVTTGVLPRADDEGSEQLRPVAGQLLARACSRREELDADRHAVELLRRLG
jgi:hypothetical protein